MPNCFQLFKRNGDGKPVAFNLIDAEMCEHFKAPIHPTQYYYDWYGTAGFAIACCGRTLEKQIAECQAATEIDRSAEETRYIEVLQWLNEHYTSEAWAEIGRR